jgi:crotonobetainyl-CoA:carnitine CoA-transferase CaiB-like acyl-CoA transferase
MGAWANALSIDLSLAKNEPWPRGWLAQVNPANPLGGAYRTADDCFLYLNVLDPGRYWPEFCRIMERDDLLTDPRCATPTTLMQNAAEMRDIVRREIVSRPLQEWTERLSTFGASWAAAQDSLQLGHDRQLRANHLVAEIVDADGHCRELVANPVQFDEVPAVLRRGPLFAENTDDILRELGRTDDEIQQLKRDEAVA